MNNLKSFRRWMTCWMTWSLVAAGVFTLGASMTAAQPPTPQPLSANDVSILFPAPRNAKDLANLIPLSTLNGPAGSGRVWSDADFNGSWRSLKIRRCRSPAGLPPLDCPRSQAHRRLVHCRHPHRPGRAGPFQGDHRTIRTTAADTVYRATGDAVRRHFPCARHRRPSDFQLLRFATRAPGSLDACPAPSRTWPHFSPLSVTSSRYATSLSPEHSAMSKSIPQVRSTFIRACPAHPKSLPKRAERPAGTNLVSARLTPWRSWV